MDRDFYCEKILSGKVQVERVFENEYVLAYHHTQPTWEMHIVIIPKQHIASLHETTDLGIVQKIFEAAQNLIGLMGFEKTNYKVIVNGGSYQSTPHLHFHLVSGLPLRNKSPNQIGELLV